jgi:hypothetical protein
MIQGHLSLLPSFASICNYFLTYTWVTSKVMAANFFLGKHVTVKKVQNILMKGHDIPLRLA